jgi:hypothetical protein
MYFRKLQARIKQQMLKPAIELLKSLLIADFPSGSSINSYEGKLYLIGDDANNLLILDNTYKRVDSIPLFDYPAKRIPKEQKADFESSTIINMNGAVYLLILGSASREERKKELLIPILNAGPDYKKLFIQVLYKPAFFEQLKTKGITDINVEGATIIGDHLVLANRGNIANPKNHLIFTNSPFLNTQTEVALSISKLVLPAQLPGFAGVSELCYIESKDMLLFTFSSETTNNSYDDGAIGISYIGWINNFKNKINQRELTLDEMIDLPANIKDFVREKIEGICVEAVHGNELTIHLVSDNDGGESKLFKLKVTVPPHANK